MVCWFCTKVGECSISTRDDKDIDVDCFVGTLSSSRCLQSLNHAVIKCQRKHTKYKDKPKLTKKFAYTFERKKRFHNDQRSWNGKSSALEQDKRPNGAMRKHKFFRNWVFESNWLNLWYRKHSICYF
jgi:hypothetical protein